MINHLNLSTLHNSLEYSVVIFGSVLYMNLSTVVFYKTTFQTMHTRLEGSIRPHVHKEIQSEDQDQDLL